jgi:hypothetical protein
MTVATAEGWLTGFGVGTFTVCRVQEQEANNAAKRAERRQIMS